MAEPGSLVSSLPSARAAFQDGRVVGWGRWWAGDSGGPQESCRLSRSCAVVAYPAPGSFILLPTFSPLHLATEGMGPGAKEVL